MICRHFFYLGLRLFHCHAFHVPSVSEGVDISPGTMVFFALLSGGSVYKWNGKPCTTRLLTVREITVCSKSSGSSTGTLSVLVCLCSRIQAVMHVKYRIKVGYHQQAVKVLVYVAQLDVSATCFHGLVSANDNSDSR